MMKKKVLLFFASAVVVLLCVSACSSDDDEIDTSDCYTCTFNLLQAVTVTAVTVTIPT